MECLPTSSVVIFSLLSLVCLNPYSNGMLADMREVVNPEDPKEVLILILMECVSTLQSSQEPTSSGCLNPYSDGMRDVSAKYFANVLKKMRFAK